MRGFEDWTEEDVKKFNARNNKNRSKIDFDMKDDKEICKREKIKI